MRRLRALEATQRRPKGDARMPLFPEHGDAKEMSDRSGMHETERGRGLTTREWLMRARRTDQRIKALLESKQAAYYRATSATAVPKIVPGGGGGFQSKSETYALLSAEVDEQIEELNRIRTEILHATRSVKNSTLATLLIEYYVNGKTWEQVAVDMGYSWRHIQRLHGLALKKIEDGIQCRGMS